MHRKAPHADKYRVLHHLTGGCEISSKDVQLQRGGHDDHFDAILLHEFLDQIIEEVRIHRALVHLVQHEVCVLADLLWVVREICKQVSDRAESNLRALRALVITISNAIPDQPTHTLRPLMSNSTSQRDGRYAARLCHQNSCTRPPSMTVVEDELRHHRAFPAASLAQDACNRIYTDAADDLGAKVLDWQRVALRHCSPALIPRVLRFLVHGACMLRPTPITVVLATTSRVAAHFKGIAR